MAMDTSNIRTLPTSVIAIIVLTITLSAPLHGAEAILEADRLEITPNRTLARGNVKFSGSGFVVSSETFQLLKREDSNSRNLAASGGVKLTAGRVEIEAKELNGELPEGGRENRASLSFTGGSGTIGSISFNAEEITIITEGETVSNLTLEGKAKLELSNQTDLAAERLELTAGESSWKVRAAGSAGYTGHGSRLEAAHLTGSLEPGNREESFQLKKVSAEKPSGQFSTAEENDGSAGFSFSGKEGSFTFDESGELTELELIEGSLTSCQFCRGAEEPAYSLQARRASLFPGEFLVTRSSRLESFGFPVWSNPNYFIPLRDFGLPERSYFPRIGFSGAGGLNFEGGVPFYLNRRNFGNLRADFSTANRTIGAGIDYYSGGSLLNGVGKLYGNVKNGEVNFLSADAEFGYEPRNWLQLTGEVDYRQGPFQGEIYDRNEWNLSLEGPRESPWSAIVSRGEAEINDGQSSGSKRVLKKLPEVSYGLEGLGGKDFPGTKLGGKLGYYDEYEPNWDERRTGFRGNLLGNFLFESNPLECLELSLNGLGRIDGYVTENNLDTGTRLGYELIPAVELRGPGSLTIKFEHIAGLGSSPFVFDRIEDRDRLSFSYRGSKNGLTGKLNFHYDFLPPDGISNLKYEIGFARGPLNQEVGFEYDLSRGLPEEITTSTVLSRPYGSLELKSGYDFSSREIAESRLELDLAGGNNSGSLALTGLQPGNWLKKLAMQVNVRAPGAWTFQLEGKYDFQNGQLSGLSYSINRTLQDCLRVGVSGTLEGVWFNAELAGF